MTRLLNLLPLRSWLILGAVVLLAVLTLAWCDAREDRRRARADADVAERQADLAREAAEIAHAVTEAERASDDLTRENRGEIMETENADDDAGEAGRAGLAALCRRSVYYDLPECARLREHDRAGP